MKTVIIDYHEAGSGKDAGQATSALRSGKFLQIRNDDMEYLVFSTRKLTPYHANILERFCRERGIKGSYDGEGKRYGIEDPLWAVKGGGKFEIDAKNKTVRLYDDSMAYGRFEQAGLKEKVLLMKGLSGYRVIVE